MSFSFLLQEDIWYLAVVKQKFKTISSLLIQGKSSSTSGHNFKKDNKFHHVTNLSQNDDRGVHVTI